MTQRSYPISLSAIRAGSSVPQISATRLEQSPRRRSGLNPVPQPVAHHKIPRGHPPENQTASVLESSLITPQSTREQWEAFARYHLGGEHTSAAISTSTVLAHAGQRQEISRRQPCQSNTSTEKDGKTGYLPLSRTTDRVLRILLDGDLSRVRAESNVAELVIATAIKLVVSIVLSIFNSFMRFRCVLLCGVLNNGLSETNSKSPIFQDLSIQGSVGP